MKGYLIRITFNLLLCSGLYLVVNSLSSFFAISLRYFLKFGKLSGTLMYIFSLTFRELTRSLACEYSNDINTKIIVILLRCIFILHIVTGNKIYKEIVTSCNLRLCTYYNSISLYHLLH